MTAPLPPPSPRRAREILFPIVPYQAAPRIAAALADERLRAAVASATTLKDRTRVETLARTFGPEVDARREAAGRLRRHVLDHLDHYLARFAAAATANGTTVHVARDAAEAREIVVRIAREAGVTRCVKAKSMVTEEIALLDALVAAGVDTVETDLGEYVLQLADDAPSHIVTPMIHKSRHDAASAFTTALGVEAPPEPEALTQIARASLREAFRRADLGVTGANFLVADTGTVVLCTNEGNGRLTTTTPRVHVAVAGIEKVVPDLPALASLLELLARSSTGQPLTVYTSLLTGPRRAGELDGPAESHVVLLDNGRTRILADPRFREALACIRCGACLNACPVYRAVGGHAYGSVYPGPIGAVVTPLLRGLDAYPDLPHLTTLCGACQAACPVDIDLPRMLVALKEEQRARGVVPWRERLAQRVARFVLGGRLRFRLARFVLRKVLRRRADADGFVDRAPSALGRWTRTRSLRAPAAKPFSPPRPPKGGADGAR